MSTSSASLTKVLKLKTEKCKKTEKNLKLSMICCLLSAGITISCFCSICSSTGSGFLFNEVI